MNLVNQKVGILGAARSGIAAAYKAKELGALVYIYDAKKESLIPNYETLKTQFECEFGCHSNRIFDMDFVVISPGVPTSIPIVKSIIMKEIPIISEIEFGYQVMNKDSKIIAVTGSNGKSTTVSLIYHILKQCNKKVILAGNIGTPFTSYPIEKDTYDAIVLELSSFQLEQINDFKANVAVILNISPDHLNRYRDFAHYAETKFNIFLNQTNQDLAVFNGKNDEVKQRIGLIRSPLYDFANAQDNRFVDDTIVIRNQSYDAKKIPLKGPHNKQNIIAAISALTNYDLNPTTIYEALLSFESLPHRMEKCGECKNVSFINDSKATNTDSVQYALKSFSENIHLILGGSDKGEDFSILKSSFQKVKSIHLIGETTKSMKKKFHDIAIPVYSHCELEDATRSAFDLSQHGDIVLLSPACASYDMFDNFEHRGNEFKRIIELLVKENQ